MIQAYKITADLSQNVDDFPNVHKINVTDYPDLPLILASEKHSYNGDVIAARCNLQQIQKFDFIANDLNIPIVSSKFLNLLEIERLEEIETIPLKLIDDTFLGEIYDGDILRSDLPIINGFFSMKFKKRYDYCNQSLSQYRKLRSQPEGNGILRKPVFNIPETGNFPPIFRVVDTMSSLFISGSAQSLIKENKITGCTFEKVETVENL